MSTRSRRAVILSALVVGSIVAGSIAFTGAVIGATNVSITPDDHTAGATTNYTVEGNVELSNQDTLQYVDVHLSPANVSAVEISDISLYIDGNEYTDGFTEFSASNGVVEFKLSNSKSVSDGDPVRIVVQNVTNPDGDFHANATLHDTGDDQWQEFADSVSINVSGDIDYSDLSLSATGSDTTISVGEDLRVSAWVTNNGGQTMAYNASLKVDGQVTQWSNGTLEPNASEEVTFVTNFSSPGTPEVTVDGLLPVEVTVSGPTRIVDGDADPQAVEPDTTISHQRVHVEVANVSQDGDTDVHYVEFPNELAEGLSVNSVDANATSITSSPNLVDGFDEDGVIETVRFATSGDSGAELDLNLTVDASVTYPNESKTYGFDARTIDSSQETTPQQNVATVEVRSSVCLCGYTVSNPEGSTVLVSFSVSEKLMAIEASVMRDGNSVTSLTTSEFEAESQNDGWRYTATFTVAEDGTYRVTLTEATIDSGRNIASGETDTAVVNADTATILEGWARPSSVTPGSTVSNQHVSFEVADVSADGDTDWYYVELSDALASSLSVNSASANATGITSSPNLVDGFDNDGIEETVKFATSADGGGDVNLELGIDVSVTYPMAEMAHAVDIGVDDSDAMPVTANNVARINAVKTDKPLIAGYSVSSPSDRTVSVEFSASEQLASITVIIEDKTGANVATMSKADFAETNNSGDWHYAGTTTLEEPGTYTVTLQQASDAQNNNGAGDRTETITVESGAVMIVSGSASPNQVVPGTTMNNQVVSIEVSGVSADGSTDWYYVEFPDELAASLAVNSVSADSASITSSPNLVDGFDGDGVQDTVRFATSAGGGGDVTLTLAVDVSVDYPTVAAQYAVDARVVDSAGTTTATGIATIDAGDISVPDYVVPFMAGGGASKSYPAAL